MVCIRDHEMCHICMKLVSGFKFNSIHVLCLVRIQPYSVCPHCTMCHNVVPRSAVQYLLKYMYRCHTRHELQSNSQLYTWIGTWKVHSISDTLEVYCYLQCKPTTFSTWEMPFFITWMHPYLSILIWVAANSDFRIRKCYFNWKDLQIRDYILRYPYKTTNLLKDEMLFK